MIRTAGALAVLVGSAAAAVLAVSPAAGQELTGWVDASAAHSRPPASLSIPAASYGLLGARMRVDGRSAGFGLGLQGGRGASSGSGSWVGGNAGADFVRSSGIFSFGGHAEASGLRYMDPVENSGGEFRHALYLGTLRPELGVSLGGTLLRAEGVFTRGSWRIESTGSGLGDLPGGGPFGGYPGMDRSTADGPISVDGATLSLTRPIGAATLELRGERYSAENQATSGTYQGGAATIGFGFGRFDAALGGRVWSAPLVEGGSSVETGFDAAIGTALSRDVYAQLGMSNGVSDAVYGSAGSFGISLGVSVRLGSSRIGSPLPVKIGEPAGTGRKVEFRVRQSGASRVAVAGDFTGWKLRPMRRDADGWVLELVLDPGVYHFSFVVDGERWIVPEDAPGIVDDGFGRRNATLVVER